MIEFLMAKWVEVVIGFIIMGGLLAMIVVSMWYQKMKDDLEDEYAELKKMLPELPRKKKKK